MIFRYIIIICPFLLYFPNLGGGSQTNCNQTETRAKPCENNQTFLCPTTEAQVQALIRDASTSGSTIVRVIGSAHSYERVILDDRALNKKTKLNIISFQNYRGVDIYEKEKVAVVKAGTYIGVNPETTDEENKKSLAVILNKAGYGLPGLSGITRQTISGYLCTGTAGGSLYYTLYDAVVGVRLIDGNGRIHNIDKNHPKFPAVGLSLSLMGIITSVNISLTTKSYYIKGLETISPVEPLSSNLSQGCPIDIFGNGTPQYPNLTEFFKTGGDYSRLFWYPQKSINRVAIWKASRYNQTPLPPLKPYRLFPSDNFTAASIRYANALTRMNLLAEDTQEYYSIEYSILDTLIPIGEQDFFDIYDDSLAMDNKLSYAILPITLFEVFIPFDRAQEVANVLRNYYLTQGVSATSNTAFEIYTGRKSKFWLSPSYNTDVVRVGWYWFGTNTRGTAPGYFRQFADLMKPFKYRCHWGKYLFDDFSGERVHEVYPMLKKWLKIRNEMDPKQIFVTPYWRKIFSIPVVTSTNY